MAEERVQRRLAAILAADVVGYSRLMGKDEEGTLAALTAHRTELIEPGISKHRGRLVKTTGDGLLAEFASVVDAVRFAVAFQDGMAERNGDIPKDQRIEFRVGVNLGDVIFQDDDVYGDGVNVAARLEALADPGGVVVSGMVHEAVRAKLDVGFDDLGPQNVKNIADPVPAFRVVREGQKAVPLRKNLSSRWRIPAMVAGVVLLIAAGGVAWWQPWVSDMEPASIDKMAFPLPEKPSIVVLPFANLSGDKEQEYFVDGMTEDLITDLSKVSGLFVIARNSAFTYKGEPIQVKRIAQELGVRYVLEGSVRKIGVQVRINAQLVDALTGGHVWAERYDGDLRDVLEFQDAVLGKIVAALAVRLTAREKIATVQKGTENPEAYDAFLKGRGLFNQRRPESLRKALGNFEQAVALDPGYSQAYAALAATYWQMWKRYWGSLIDASSPHLVRVRAETYLEKALQNPTPLAYQLAASMLAQKGRHAEALSRAEQAIASDPNDADSYIALAGVLNLSGRAEEALAAIARAERLNPHHPPFYLYEKGLALFLESLYVEAKSSLEQAVALNSLDRWSSRLLLAVYGHLGKTREAEELFTAAESNWRGFDPLTIRGIGFWYPFKRSSDARHLADGLRKAGVPD